MNRKLRIVQTLTSIALFTLCLCCYQSLYAQSPNFLDRVNLGNAGSEAVHAFDAGFSSVPTAGIGAYGQTYREPIGTGVNNLTSSQAITVTMRVDPNLQNYFTIKIWGNDVNACSLYFWNDLTLPAMVNQGGPPQAPNRFLFYTFPIPLSQTQGQTTASLTLNGVSYYDKYFGTGFHYLAAGQTTQPVYSLYTHVDPHFSPDPLDQTGAAPTPSAPPVLQPLSSAEAYSILQINRSMIFSPGQYWSSVLARQVPQDQTGAPVETWGLDLFTTVSTWAAANPSATPDQWRNQTSNNDPGPGYTAFPDELLSNLYIGYITPPFVNASGQTVTGLDDYHDPALIQKIVNAMDSVSYSQCSDGGMPQQGQDWPGLTSTPLVTGTYAGLTGRQPSLHGGGDLQGVNTYTLGWVIIGLLNDPKAAPIFESYLTKTYDADLDGSSYERATAYERMLSNAINFYTLNTGGAESQNTFEMIELYAMQVALEKLQILYPNSSYPALAPETGLSYAEMVLGLYPDILRGLDDPSGINYGLTEAGLGEAHGQMSSGFDGRYGGMLPSELPRFYLIAQQDPGLTSADQETIADMLTMGRATVDSYDHFLSMLDNASIGSNGIVVTDHPTIAQEDFITYRNTWNPNVNATSFVGMSRYESSDPSQGINDAFALRSAYLETQYGYEPVTGMGNYGYVAGGLLQYIKDPPFYELTIKSLIGVSPASLTPLPGEPGQPDFTWCDVTNGATAFIHNGERFYMNAN